VRYVIYIYDVSRLRVKLRVVRDFPVSLMSLCHSDINQVLRTGVTLK
jgi:hypothetical protein